MDEFSLALSLAESDKYFRVIIDDLNVNPNNVGALVNEIFRRNKFRLIRSFVEIFRRSPPRRN